MEEEKARRYAAIKAGMQENRKVKIKKMSSKKTKKLKSDKLTQSQKDYDKKRKKKLARAKAKKNQKRKISRRPRRSGMTVEVVKRDTTPVSEEIHTMRERVQNMGYGDGAKIPGSHIRKVTR